MRFFIGQDENFFVDVDKAYIAPPAKIPLFIRFGAFIARKILKKDLLLLKILAHYPKTALSSAILESLVTHDDSEINKRLLKIIRIEISCLVACPFCIDMNAFAFESAGLTSDEVEAIRRGDYENASFSAKERLIMAYTRLATQTPVIIPKDIVDNLRANFSERGLVIIASTIAQVNYWARLIRGLGIPVAGFGDMCKLER